MNPLEDPRTLIGALSDLEVRTAAWLCQEPLPVTQKHLCNVLHKTDKTVAIALYNLEFYQICTHSQLGWSVTANVTLLGLCLPEALQVISEPEVPVEKPVEKGRKFSDPNAPSTTSSTSSINNLTSLKLKENLLLELLGPETEPEQVTEPEPKQENSKEYQACYKAARAAGIWELSARELAKLPYVTPELIEYHVEKVLSEKKEIPLAIFRIKQNREIRKIPDQKTQDWQDRQKYVTGKYADQIVH